MAHVAAKTKSPSHQLQAAAKASASAARGAASRHIEEAQL